MNYSLTGLIVPVGKLYLGALQTGDREATDAEIEMYGLCQARTSLLAQVESLERDAMMPHGLRVFVIGSMEKEAIAAGATRVPPLTPAQSKAALQIGNTGYRRLIELHAQVTLIEGQIAALDAQIQALEVQP